MKKFLNDCKRYYKYVICAGKAELKSDIAQSHLSWLWWFLDPLLFMMVYTFVALVIFGRGEKYFSAFIFIGYTSYKFFEKTLKTSVKLVAANKSIVKKVYIPKYILVFIKLFVNGFTFAVSFLLVFCTMIYYRVPITWYMLEFFPLVFLLFFVTFGFSLILLHFGVFVEDLSNVISVGLRLVFYLSGVFYSLKNRLDSATLQTLLLKCNPMAFIIDQMRGVLLYEKGIEWKIYFMWICIAVLLSAFGLRLVNKNENGYVKVI